MTRSPVSPAVISRLLADPKATQALVLSLRSQAKGEQERRRLERAWKGDFATFCGKLDIIPKGGKRTKLQLNPIQEKYNRTRTARDVVLKPRQIGFTTLELARDIHEFVTVPGARVVVVVQSITDHGPLKQVSQAIRIMLEGLRAEGVELNFRTETLSEWVLADRDASLRIVEAGASEAAAETKGRSGTITRLHLTETAFYEYAEATLNALLECVPGPEFGSSIVIESTANGAAGMYYDQYQAASKRQSGFTAHFYPWWEQPEYALPLDDGEVIEPEGDRERAMMAAGATRENLKWYRRKVAEKKRQELVDQEYPSDPETCFLVAGRTFFDRDITVRLRAKTRDPIAVEMAGELRIWKQPEPGKDYVATVDPSEGVGGDPGAVIVQERDTGEHVATLHGQFPVGKLAARADAIGLKYNTALLVVERNNHGHAVLEALVDPPKSSPREAYPNLFRAADGRPGWYSTEVSRSAALDKLEEAHRDGHWWTPDVRVIGEMLTFVVWRSGKAAASPGAHDDLVLPTAIGWDVLSKPISKEKAPPIRTTDANTQAIGFG